MTRSKITAVTGLLLLTACNGGGAQSAASPTVSPPGSAAVSEASPTPTAVQTAIPDGVYRTRPRTAHDLDALGLTKTEIATVKENEVWDETIVYELRIHGDEFVLTAASDGGAATSADHGTFEVHGNTLVITSFTPPPAYWMRFSLDHGKLRLTLTRNALAKTEPECCSDAMVRAAYEALPFEAVS